MPFFMFLSMMLLFVWERFSYCGFGLCFPSLQFTATAIGAPGGKAAPDGTVPRWGAELLPAAEASCGWGTWEGEPAERAARRTQEAGGRASAGDWREWLERGSMCVYMGIVHIPQPVDAAWMTAFQMHTTSAHCSTLEKSGVEDLQEQCRKF